MTGAPAGRGMAEAGETGREDAALKRRQRTALLALAAMLALLLLAMMDTVRRLAALWMIEDGYYSYGFLILPVSLLLIWRRRRALADLVPQQEPLAIPALLLTDGFWLASRAAEIATFEYLALPLSACLLVFALQGRRIVRRLAFPLVFLAFMLPFGGPLLPALQTITTHFADTLLWLAGIPTYREGTLIETSFGLFNIAEACAGLQFLAANLVAGVLFAHLAFSSPVAQALVIAVSVIAPILINGLRAFGIIAVIHLSGDAGIAGPDHIVYGWVLFMAAIVVTFVVGAKFADWPKRGQAPATPAPTPETDGPAGPWRLAFLAPLALSVLAAPALQLWFPAALRVVAE
ncbi:MAG: exosortase [Alphaproteobacteria bacterium]